MKVGDKLIRVIDGEEGTIIRRTVHRLEVKMPHSTVKMQFSTRGWGIEDTEFKYPEEVVEKAEEPKLNLTDEQELNKVIYANLSLMKGRAFCKLCGNEVLNAGKRSNYSTIRLICESCDNLK